MIWSRRRFSEIIPGMNAELITPRLTKKIGRTLAARFFVSIALSASVLVCSGCATLGPGTAANVDATDVDTAMVDAPTSADSSEQEKPPLTFKERRENVSKFFRAKFGESAGVDPRAREIERRLGF